MPNSPSSPSRSGPQAPEASQAPDVSQVPEASQGPAAPQAPQATGTPCAGRRSAAYAQLFAVPGATAFTVGSVLARLPMGMLSVSAVIMIAGTRGSYALAGAVTATGLAATAVVAPLTARLVDRHGQARVAVPAVVCAALGSLSLAACVRYGAPDWTLFASYAATAVTPNTGGIARARWTHLLRDEPAARHTANSLEQAADELCFMAGPVLAAWLCTALFPELGTLTGAVLLLAGTLLFTAQRRTEPPLAAAGALRTPAPLRLRGIPPLLAGFLCTGAVFGALEVVTLAYADGQGHRAAGGAVLACQAAGSALAGLAFGLLRPRGALHLRLLLCVAAMAAMMLLPLLAAATGNLPVLAAALLVAGMATAPTMVTGMTLVQETVPAARLNEGMTLAVTALLGGIAAGAAAGGWAAEHAGGGTWPYTVPVLAALLAAAVPAGATAARGPRPGTAPHAVPAESSTGARAPATDGTATDGTATGGGAEAAGRRGLSGGVAQRRGEERRGA